MGWCSGIFVCGERPLWLLAMRGTLVAHPMTVEGAVLGFTPFHNINCPRVRVVVALNRKCFALGLPFACIAKSYGQ